MKKHKQHLIDHNTLESTAQKVDSSTAAMDRHADKSARDDNSAPSLRGSEATEAKQGEAEASLVIHTNADSSVKVDRHADKSARDDREKVDSSMDRHATASAVSRDDRETINATNLNTPLDSTAQPTKAVTPTLTPSPQDFRICDDKAGLCSGEQGDKTRASIDAASHKLPTLSRKAESRVILCACSEFVYLGSLPYTLRLPTGKTYPLHQGDSFIVPQGDLSRYLEYKSTMFKKLR